MSRHEPSDTTLAETAARWLVLRDAGWDDPTREAFERWCRQDPRHRAAVAELDAAWSVLDRPRASGRQELVRVELSRLRRRRRQRRLGVAAVAAVLLVGLGGWFGSTLSGSFASTSPLMAQTDGGRARSASVRVALPDQQLLSDGSVVELGPLGRIRVEFDDTVRRVYLEDGEAHFVVAKDKVRPFVVSVGGVEVRAVGTVFAVRLTPDDVEVVVSEGRVALDQPVARSAEPARSESRATLTFLDAGERAIVPIPEDLAALAPPIPEVTPITPEQLTERLAWRLPRLEFTDTTLAEAAALFNQHGTIRLDAADSAVRAVRVTGLFRADNVEGFVTLLESSFGIQAERRSEHLIVLHGAP